MRDLLGGSYSIDHSGPLQSITDLVTHVVTHVVTQCMDIVTQGITNMLIVNSYSVTCIYSYLAIL